MTLNQVRAPGDSSVSFTTMGSFLQCLRSCLEDDDDSPELTQQQPVHDEDTPNTTMDRADHGYPICCAPHDESPPPWLQFWRKLHKQRRYQHLESSAAPPHAAQQQQHCRDDETLQSCSSLCSSVNRSPLRTAQTFDSSQRDVLTIRMEEIVLPGSALQHAMALKMSESMMGQKTVDGEEDEECVICMEGFSHDNPRMPTLCGCGSNRTYFHLPCLYQWREQSQDCPSCRQRITWEEF